MTKQRSTITPMAYTGDLYDLFSRPTLFPDEDPAEFEDLRAILLLELAPATPYQRALAENLVALEWEAIRHRRLRNGVIKSKVRDVAIALFCDKTLWTLPEYKYNLASQKLAFDLLSADSDRVAKAITALEKMEIGPEELVARAYSLAAGPVELHERKLADIEVRRRRLREDYDRLKAARARPVEEADVVA